MLLADNENVSAQSSVSRIGIQIAIIIIISIIVWRGLSLQRSVEAGRASERNLTSPVSILHQNNRCKMNNVGKNEKDSEKR